MPMSRSFWYSRSVSVRAGRDRDRVAGVHADGVDVLDRADDDGVVGRVAHELELVLLPAEDRLLEEHLGRGRVVEALGHDAHQVLLGVGEARAEAAHRERRPHDERVPEVERELLGLLERLRDVRAGDLGSGLDHEVLEELAVFALADGIDLRADELDAVLLEDARVVQGDRRVQRGLAAQRRQHRIGPLLDDDRLDDLGRDRLDVRRVGEVGVGHDRGRIGVHEDDPHALGSQHPAGLRARVVELGRLSDDDRTGSDDEDAVDVVALGHQALDSLLAMTMSRNRSKR